MEMVRRILMYAAFAASTAAAADFSLSIGNAFAALVPGGATTPVVKKTGNQFAVRMQNCDSPDQAHLNGTAEGLVQGARTSAAVSIDAASPGIYVVSPTGTQPQGAWVVSLFASCGGAKAGALVPIGPQGFLRDKVKLLPRAATKTEVDAALKALPGGSVP
jgi:hypothetical protein